MTALAAAGPSAYWYLTRGSGTVSLLLLTASVVLGLLGSLRFAAAPRWPRFTVQMLHRDISMLVVALLAVHIITGVLDSFAPIKLTDAVIPFVSSYRPLWIGFGALAFDLVIALVITSLVRRRLGYRAWRAVHWFAYACWPVAVLHGLGSGSDTKAWWLLALTVACVAAVMVAIWTRLARLEPGRSNLRPWGFAASIVLPIAAVIFTLQGPLRSGWAGRAGTPATLLAKTSAPLPRSSAASRPVSTGTATPRSFSVRLTGRVTQTLEPNGALIDLALRLRGSVGGRLRVRLAGSPIAGGGLSLTGSQVDLSSPTLPSVMEGKIVSLQGQAFVARVESGSGRSLDLRANLNIDSQSRTVAGTLDASPSGGGQ